MWLRHAADYMLNPNLAIFCSVAGHRVTITVYIFKHGFMYGSGWNHGDLSFSIPVGSEAWLGGQHMCSVCAKGDVSSTAAINWI